MTELKLSIDNADCCFTIDNVENPTGATLTRFDGNVAEFSLPSEIALEGRMIPVTGIGRKALMGNRRLQKLTLPETLIQIDDWALAGCRRLREVTMPRAKLGKGVFQDCEGLRKIRFSDGGSEDVAALLSEVARHDIVYLLDLPAAGSAEWLRQWDAWLLRFLEQSDQEGYSGQVPCGEEDYGTSDVGSYESGRRREKAERCLLRLMYKESLDADLEKRLADYISGHTKGSAEGEGAWQMLLKKHPEEKEWYQAFAVSGGLNGQNRDALLADIPEEYAEMKAYFINHGQSEKKTEDFFAGLAL